MKQLKKILSILIRLIYFGFLFALLISYLSPYANPGNFWVISFLGLGYPYILLINILFLFWWIIRWKKLYWLSLICILSGWTNMKNLFHIAFSAGNVPEISIQSAKEPGHITLLSSNVRLFDLYNWTQNKNTRRKIFSFLKNEPANIICLQEFFQVDSGPLESIDTLMNLIRAEDYHAEYTITLRNNHHWGIATFSKYPIVNKGAIRFKTRSNNICIWTDIKIKQDTIRVYNLHLQSIRFGYADYKFMEAIKQKNDTLDAEDIEIASKNILRRIKRAFVIRAQQTEMVTTHIASCRYPVIVCGDFNDTPFSYTYHEFSKLLQDAFMKSGSGTGNTYLGIFPSYRIDYIFHSDDFNSSGFTILQEEISDHYPIRCDLTLK